MNETSNNKTSDDETSDDKTLQDFIESKSYTEAIEFLQGKPTLSQDGLDQSLISACRHGHKYLIQELVRHGANVQYKDIHGNTALLICAGNGFIDSVRYLLTHKASVNDVNSAGDTALILSVCSSGSIDLTKLLLEQDGIDINQQNRDGSTALMKAIEALDIDTIKLLLDKSQEIEQKSQEIEQKSNRVKNDYSSNILDPTEDWEGRKVDTLASSHKHGDELLQLSTDNRVSHLVSAVTECDIKCVRNFLDFELFNSSYKSRFIDELFAFIFRNHKLKRNVTFDNKQIEKVKKLLEGGADINRTWISDDTSETIKKHQIVSLALDTEVDIRCNKTCALKIAAETGDCALIEVLLGFGADINLLDFGNSPLECALYHGHTECANLLIKHGATMDIKLALMFAVHLQKPKYMNFLFDNYRQEILKENCIAGGYGLLISAVQGENLEIIDTILKAGADINAVNIFGHTPLVKARNAEVARFLIQRGANVNLVTGDKFKRSTPLTHILSEHFRENTMLEVVQVLLESGASVSETSEGATALILAAIIEGRTVTLQTLLDYGADFNGRDMRGNTALMRAVYEGCSQNVLFLLEFAKENNLCLDAQNHGGSTALMLAVDRSKVRCVEMLLDHGAGVNIKDVKGNTALICAVTCKEDTIVKLLIDHGADVNIKDGKGKTALMIAADWQKETNVKLLIDHGADVNIRDLNGNTALIIALKSNKEIVADLIKAGSDVNCQNVDGFSPLMVAASKCKPDVITVLLDSGADVNAVSERDHRTTAMAVLLNHFEARWEETISLIVLLDRGASSSIENQEVLHKMITHRLTDVVPKLIQGGLAPADVNTSLLGDKRYWLGHNYIHVPPTVSPLCVAVLIGDINLVRYFVGNLFLTKSDLSFLALKRTSELRPHHGRFKECLDFLDETSSQPLSLFQLAFVTVSSAVGTFLGRENRINKLPLPQVMKDKLLFKSVDVQLTRPPEDNRSLNVMNYRDWYPL